MSSKATQLFAAAFAAFALAGLGACASNGTSGGTRTVGQFTDDAALTAKVKSAIASDAGAHTAANVNVNTYRGVVQLTGFVDSQDQVNQAVAAAEQVKGVHSVKNDLRVKSQ